MMRLLCATTCVCLVLIAYGSAQSQGGADARNMELVGHNDLNGRGDGGEGLIVGDVLTGIDSTPIESPDRLLEALSGRGGQAATLHVRRGGSATDVAITIGEK